jgi:hypothetical protein
MATMDAKMIAEQEAFAAGRTSILNEIDELLHDVEITDRDLFNAGLTIVNTMRARPVPNC